MSRPPLRLGTRKSPMAMAQSGQVARLITERTGVSVELVGVTTFGDVTRADLAQIGGTGVFASALRETLLAARLTWRCTHSRTSRWPPPPGWRWPRSRPGKTRGTRWPPGTAPSSPTWPPGPPSAPARRAGRPSYGYCAPISGRWRSGNAGTRLAKVETGELDAVLLASAGLARIRRLDAVTQIFEPEEMLPAPDRARWRWNAGPATLTWPRCWPRWTTGSAGLR